MGDYMSSHNLLVLSELFSLTDACNAPAPSKVKWK